MKKIQLNQAQQAAVDHIYGPLLVLAGPGTGKTQLLSARIANILQKTDANPQNILCLTFTENAARNMRERLSSLIGAAAYDVHIGTYHSFGSDIITSYPEFFEKTDIETGEDSRLERPIDDLQKIQIVENILSSLPYNSPLIGAKHYVKSVTSTISELKRGLYTPDSLRELALQNIATVNKISPLIADELGHVTRMPSSAERSLELFGGVLEVLIGGGLASLAYDELEHAMAEASDSNSSKPLTAWKNNWLTKDSENRYMLTDLSKHERMTELSKVYEAYQKELNTLGLYDFDDMILRSIGALSDHDDLRFTLQEKYQFILLDEFQDTNTAQFELVRLLADNPVNEGQPNLFAVGDDDQAIYAFQGAKLSNMLKFTKDFQNVTVINLVENYRSHPDILLTASNVAEQLESRLHHKLQGIDKTLVASGTYKNAQIERHQLESQANEYAWAASKAKGLIDSGVSPDQIAVLAPKHALLEASVPFFISESLPVAYEKRENILDTKLISSFKLMSQLVIACHTGDVYKMNEYLPQVLSLDFYNLPVHDIWKINWQLRTPVEDSSWAELALEHELLAPHVLFYLKLSLRSETEPLEYMLDLLTGTTSISLDTEIEYTCPLKDYYFSKQDDALSYYESLANLSTIREHLRAYQAGSSSMLIIEDFIDFMAAYESADQPLINSHPIALSQKSIQLMTAYKAKGLEFEHVFILSAHDDIWGKKARGNSNKLSLPANLQHVRYQGSSEDELKRILFVAITRAKEGLYITSHATKDTGKATEPVKYLLESDNRSLILPDASQTVMHTTYNHTETMNHIELLWQTRHLNLTTDLRNLLKDRLANYQMSPTHLNTITDDEYGGWDVFMLGTLLRFPQAPGEDGEFGNAVHETLDWFQKNQTSSGKAPSIKQAIKKFDDQLGKHYISARRTGDYRARGHRALESYLTSRVSMFSASAKPEVDFKKEGVLIGDAHLTGKIDRLEVDSDAKTVRIVDFKTGGSEVKWSNYGKLKKYKQQLYFYKILIEGSHTWRGYTVEDARLEFVEPDSSGKIIPPLILQHKQPEEDALKELIQSLWVSIQELKDPNA